MQREACGAQRCIAYSLRLTAYGLQLTAYSLQPATYVHNSLIFNNIINKTGLTFLKLTGLCILRSNY
jgi:hypothetical protein